MGQGETVESVYFIRQADFCPGSRSLKASTIALPTDAGAVLQTRDCDQVWEFPDGAGQRLSEQCSWAGILGVPTLGINGGQTITTPRLRPGDSFGELALLYSIPSSAQRQVRELSSFTGFCAVSLSIAVFKSSISFSGITCAKTTIVATENGELWKMDFCLDDVFLIFPTCSYFLHLGVAFFGRKNEGRKEAPTEKDTKKDHVHGIRTKKMYSRWDSNPQWRLIH